MIQSEIVSQKFFDIPSDHMMIAVYAGYHIGANATDPTRQTIACKNADIAARARNASNMSGVMQKYFANEDSPWIVLDDSDRWLARRGIVTKQACEKEIGNGYFINLYHKASGKIVIVTPGMEKDKVGDHAIDMRESWIGRAMGDIGDIAFNVSEIRNGGTHLRQARAIAAYLSELQHLLQHGAITVDGGGVPTTLRMARDEDMRLHVILAGHSAGTIPMMTLSGLGYPSFLIEPRAYSARLEQRMLYNLSSLGYKMDAEDFRAALDKGVYIRSSFPNTWNSNILGGGEFKSKTFGRNYVYHYLDAKWAKNWALGGLHRVDECVPSLLGLREAKFYIDKMSFFEDAVPGRAVRQFVNTISEPFNIGPIMQP